MENMRAIRTRIRSIESTRQITRSMKMVAASKLRKTQTAAASLREFAGCSSDMLAAVLSASGKGTNPFLTAHSEKKTVLYVLFVGNRGLCGTYNLSVLKYLQELVKENGEAESRVVVCGRWGRELIAGTQLKVIKTFDGLSDTPSADDARELTEYLKNAYLSGEADEIVLVYQSFGSVLSQTPSRLVLLPMQAKADGESGARDYIFEPDKRSLLHALTELYISNTVYSTLLEAKTGEHASRMTAMTAASDNTDELIAELNLKLNHARQAAITTEISEIVGGAAAL